jgi:hypothetical protein
VSGVTSRSESRGAVVVFYVSDHARGHAARVIEIITAVSAVAPDMAMLYTSPSGLDSLRLGRRVESDPTYVRVG